MERFGRFGRSRESERRRELRDERGDVVVHAPRFDDGAHDRPRGVVRVRRLGDELRGGFVRHGPPHPVARDEDPRALARKRHPRALRLADHRRRREITDGATGREPAGVKARRADGGAGDAPAETSEPRPRARQTLGFPRIVGDVVARQTDERRRRRVGGEGGEGGRRRAAPRVRDERDEDRAAVSRVRRDDVDAAAVDAAAAAAVRDALREDDARGRAALARRAPAAARDARPRRGARGVALREGGLDRSERRVAR